MTNEDRYPCERWSTVGDGQVQLESPDELMRIDESETWSDDPVRMYLTQDGRDPVADPPARQSTGQRIEENPSSLPRTKFASKTTNVLVELTKRSRRFIAARSGSIGPSPSPKCGRFGLEKGTDRRRLTQPRTLQTLPQRNRHELESPAMSKEHTAHAPRPKPGGRSADVASPRRSPDRRTAVCEPNRIETRIGMLEKFLDVLR